jgi:WD40 repeat protein
MLLELDGHDFASALAFSPDGSHLALGNRMAPFSGLQVDVWRLENGRGLQTLDGLSGRIALVEFSRDGNRVAAMSHQWEIGVWDLKSGQLLYVFQAPAGPFADNAAIAFSDDNRSLAFTSGTNAVLWDLKNGKSKAWPLNPGFVDNVAFHPGLGKFLSCRVETKGGKWPAAGAPPIEHPRVARIREWSSKGLLDIAEITDFNWHVSKGAMARNASVLVLDGIDAGAKGKTRTVRIYSLPAAKELWSETIDPAAGSGGDLPLDPAGKFFSVQTYAVGKPLGAKLLEIGDGKTTNWLFIPQTLGPEAHFATTTANEGRDVRSVGLELRRNGQKTPLVTFPSRNSVGTAVQFNRAGTHFAWGTDDGAVILCDIAATQAKLAELHLGW